MNPFFKYFKQYRMPVSRFWYQQFPQRVKKYHTAKLVSLPIPKELECSLTQALFDRQSSGVFNNKAISLDDLSMLLHYSAAQYEERDSGHVPGDVKLHRPYPSGGAKYPIEIYPVIKNVSGLNSGIYHYLPDSHELEEILQLNEEVLEQLLDDFGYEYAKDVSCMLMYSFVKERSLPKYGYFAYKVGLIEAGHISQNMYLLAACLGLQCCAFGGFEEKRFHDRLQIDGYNETLFYAVGLSGAITNHD